MVIKLGGAFGDRNVKKGLERMDQKKDKKRERKKEIENRHENKLILKRSKGKVNKDQTRIKAEQTKGGKTTNTRARRTF